MNPITQNAFFDPLIDYIEKIDPDGFILIRLPETMVLHTGTVMAYIDNPEIGVIPNHRHKYLKGRIKQAEIIDYLRYKKHKVFSFYKS